jgi:hypothetical protein
LAYKLIAISFMVKLDKEEKPCTDLLHKKTRDGISIEKLNFAYNQFTDIKFEYIHPHKHHNWLNLTESWDKFIRMLIKVQNLKKHKGTKLYIQLFSLGLSQSR